MALTTALCVVGRLSFQFIPNIQPMTAIFLIVTLQLGVIRGWLVCLLAVLLTNFYLGMGSWTLSQLLSFGVLIGLWGLVGKSGFFRGSLLFQIAGAVCSGFLYGFLISAIDVQIYGMPNFLVYYLQGISFDALHAAGNGIFYAILAPILGQVVKKRWLKEG